MSSGSPHVLIDANVFFSRTLRDWILMCQLEGEQPMFYLHWTEDILAEVLTNLRARNPMSADSLTTGVRDRIIDVIPDGRISGFTIDSNRTYRDPKDAHVHAAAVHGNVDLLVTQNFKDFTDDELDKLPYEVVTADQFLVLIDDSAPMLVRQVTRKQVEYFNKWRTSYSLPDALERADAPQFAARVLSHLQSEHC